VPLPSSAVVASRSRFQTLLWAAVWTVPVLTGLAAVQLGKSAGFDFLVYHYYNGFAALNGRLNFDILPAGRQTFFNPAADIFLYELTQNLPARLVGFILGVIHGLNFVLATAIASRVLPSAKDKFSEIIPALLAGAGFLGALNFGLLGSFHQDNLVSVFFLGSLLIYCGKLQKKALSDRQSLAWQALAGLCVGAGLGLKLSLAPFAVAILTAPLFLQEPILRRVMGLLSCGIGSFAGLLLTGGYHMARMYEEFGNPLFPFLAQFSTPPYDQFIGGRDLRYQPDGWLEFLFYPFVFAFHPMRVSEFPYWDFRVPVTFAAALVFILILGWRYVSRWLRSYATAPPVWSTAAPATLFLGVVGVGYLAWLCSASIYRYAAPIELLSFIILAVPLFDLLERKRAVIALGILAAIILPSTQRFGIGRLAWGNERYVVTHLPEHPRAQKDALVLIVGANAGTYFIPAFPSSARFLGTDVVDTWPAYKGELRGPPAPESMLEPFPHIMHEFVNKFRGQVLLVFLDNDRNRVEPVLRSYHFGSVMRSCGLIQSNVAAVPPLWLCELRRI